jgi:hypothetical protein
VAVLMVTLFTAARPADAAVITIQLTGTIGLDDVVFGETGPAVPFDFSLTYDTSLGSQTGFVAAGTPIGRSTFASDLYGYSRSGITSSRLTFGTHTWSHDNIVAQSVVTETADLWVDVDLTVGMPTRMMTVVEDAEGWLRFGAVQSNFVPSISNEVIIGILNVGHVSSYDVTASATTTPVPEPASLMFIGSGLLALAASRRRARKS